MFKFRKVGLVIVLGLLLALAQHLRQLKLLLSRCQPQLNPL